MACALLCRHVGPPAALLPGVLFRASCSASPRLHPPPPSSWTALTAAEQGQPACWRLLSSLLSFALTVVLKSRQSRLPVVPRARFLYGRVCSCSSLSLAALQGMQTQAASILYGSPSLIPGALEHISYVSDLKIPFMCLRLSGFYFLMFCLV